MSTRTAQLTITLAELIRTVQSVPSGELYAVVMTRGVLFDEYMTAVESLKRAKLVTEKSHVLTWSGPFIPAEKPR